MFTPQQIQEQTFSKAVFGGYDMQQVDDFLEPLTDDYIALYKENSVLKAKMKILVGKLEEYRAQETKMKQEAADAKASCDRMLEEAKAKCEELVNAAKSDAQQIQEQRALEKENERLEYAKQTALNFIEVVEADIRGHLDLLDKLKSHELLMNQKKDEASAFSPAQPKHPHEKPYDFESESFRNPPSPSAEDIASEISENLEKLVGTEPTPAPAPKQPVQHPDSATIKFADLQFGKNYNPTK